MWISVFFVIIPKIVPMAMTKNAVRHLSIFTQISSTHTVDASFIKCLKK